jgi:phage/plasmid-associated DNA primase
MKKSKKDNCGDIKDYLRIGTKYFRETYRPDKNGQLIKEFTPWDKSTIRDDFSNGELSDVRKFKGFCFLPSHTEYKEDVHGFFNEYATISHTPKEGKFENITKIMKHIFGEKHLDFGLDYLQLLYLSPTQRLPIILLESSQRNTGKSTFGNLINAIYEQNVIKLGNSDLESAFNAYWTKKLMIIVDETSISKEGAIQMLKRFSTESGTVVSNAKNQAQTQTEFIGKFLLASNEEGKAYPIEKGENRFAVFKVRTFAESRIEDDPDIENKMRAEIPAFLHFLKNRKMVYKESGRMFFPTEAYFTDQLDKYYKNSLTFTAKAIQSFVLDSFEFFEEQGVLTFSISNLLYELKSGDYVKYLQKQEVKRALDELQVQKMDKKGRFSSYSLHRSDGVSGYHLTNENTVGFVFYRDQFKAE